MKVVEVKIPDGKYCNECKFLQRKPEWCNYLKVALPDEDRLRFPKSKYCPSLKEKNGKQEGS